MIINGVVKEWKTEELKRSDFTGYKSAIVCMLSDKIRVIGTSDFEKIDWDECIEAWFFNEVSEIHIFREGSSLQAMFWNEENIESCDIRYRIRGGKGLLVREYFEKDADGQAVIIHRRPVNIE